MVTNLSRFYGSFRRIPKTLLAALLIALPATTALAEPVVYECRVQPTASVEEFWGPFDNLIQTQMRITIDGDSAIVEDPLITSVYGGPIQGELIENTDGKFVVRWRMAGKGFALARATFMFRAAFLKKRSILLVSQAIPTYNTTFLGRGSCVAFPGGLG
jgi:hypothetical protein